MIYPAVHQNPGSGLLLSLGITVSLIVWIRLAKSDPKLIFIYVAALIGAFLGGKISYLLSEGVLHLNQHWDERVAVLLTGKSITGGLLGGFLGVELTKKLLKYRRPTGDLFAIVVPLGVMVGRLGCLLHGCCRGKAGSYPILEQLGLAGDKWPAAGAEFVFNLLALIGAGLLTQFRILPNQHFHIYLISYGAFRFIHEYMRDTPKIFFGTSGYQVASLLMLIAGGVGFEIRRRKQISEASGRS